MIGYAMLGTNDLDRALAFYAPLLDMLGCVTFPASSPERRTFFRKASGGPLLAIGKPWDGTPATASNGAMLALTASSRAQVDAIYAKALELGASDEGAPGVRGDDPNPFYGAYFRDCDGNKLCIFRIGPA
jgi:catechol 2,3-dioxygenase-like lactoylglutathione lyase family enzyme